MISATTFAILLWGSLALVAAVFGYLLVATLRDLRRTRRGRNGSNRSTEVRR